MKNKTVITGYGIMSCLGRGNFVVGAALQAGRSGLMAYPEYASIGLQSTFQGMPPVLSDLDIVAIPTSLRKTMGEESLWAFAAVREALMMSDLVDLSRTALIVSNDSTAQSHRNINKLMEAYHDTRYLRTSAVFQSLNSTVSMNLAQAFGIGGLSLTISAACAGGGHAIGIAHSLIQAGVIDSAIVVGAQEMGPNAFAAFDALGVFAKDGDPVTASRPFSHDRTGLVPSGGAACVILESALHAANREAQRIVATVDGYGFSTSDNLVTPSVDHIYSCMVGALSDADFDDLNAIDLVAAHATGTPAGDAAEAKAIDMLFHHNDHYHVSATKAITGHECWMAGVSQVVYSLLQMQGKFITPYRHFAGFDDDMPPLPLVTDKAEEAIDINHMLCNAFGFGGTNSSLVLSKF